MSKGIIFFTMLMIVSGQFGKVGAVYPEPNLEAHLTDEDYRQMECAAMAGVGECEECTEGGLEAIIAFVYIRAEALGITACEVVGMGSYIQSIDTEREWNAVVRRIENSSVSYAVWEHAQEAAKNMWLVPHIKHTHGVSRDDNHFYEFGTRPYWYSSLVNIKKIDLFVFAKEV